MEANKGEAARAMAVAQRSINEGNVDKAKRFLEKSIKLYPLPEAKVLLEKVNSGVPMGPSAGKENNPSGGSGFSNGSNVRHRKPAAREEPSPPVRPYTKQQEEAVRRVKGSKDFYDILGVARNADDATIKKAYRKLALRLHPDKNSAPGADEAFKEVSRAWSVLSDAQKRAHYDRFGDEEAPARRYQQRYRDEIDPEEIFNMFFGSGFGAAMGGPGVRMYRFGGGHQQRRQGHQQQQGPQNPQSLLVQLLPLIMLFALSFFSLPSGDGGIFSMEKTSSYPVGRVTKTAGVVPNIPFYVDSSFNTRYGRDRRTLSQIERQVEGAYVKVLKTGCSYERKRKDKLIYNARRSRSAQQLKKANDVQLPKCDELQRVQEQMGY